MSRGDLWFYLYLVWVAAIATGYLALVFWG
jgi:hypothetical protein